MVSKQQEIKQLHSRVVESNEIAVDLNDTRVDDFTKSLISIYESISVVQRKVAVY